LAIGKFQGVVMSSDFFFVNLPEDRRLMLVRTIVPWPQYGWQTLNLVSKS
jgi:hypothetical protein